VEQESVRVPRKTSTVVTLRVSFALSRRIEQEARRRRQTKSEIVRKILEAALATSEAADASDEARRQSLLVSGRRSEKEALRFIEHAGDERGWR
jgi:predicted DNA-binding protein